MDEEVPEEVVAVGLSVATVEAIEAGVVDMHPTKCGASVKAGRSQDATGAVLDEFTVCPRSRGTRHSGHAECLAFLTTRDTMVLSPGVSE